MVNRRAHRDNQIERADELLGAEVLHRVAGLQREHAADEGAEDGEFIAEDSRLERWMGNIYVRITRYVKAK